MNKSPSPKEIIQRLRELQLRCPQCGTDLQASSVGRGGTKYTCPEAKVGDWNFKEHYSASIRWGDNLPTAGILKLMDMAADALEEYDDEP